MKDYLTQAGTLDLLNIVYPNHKFLVDKTVPNSQYKKYRVDFRNDELKLIVEFDGESHFTKSYVIYRDQLKDNEYMYLGYKIVHIPYFIQPDTNTIKMWFDTDIIYKQTYPHGFVDKKACLPADYCNLGIQRFLSICNQCCEELKFEIYESLRIKTQSQPTLTVIPTTDFLNAHHKY